MKNKVLFIGLILILSLLACEKNTIEPDTNFTGSWNITTNQSTIFLRYLNNYQITLNENGVTDTYYWKYLESSQLLYLVKDNDFNSAEQVETLKVLKFKVNKNEGDSQEWTNTYYSNGQLMVDTWELTRNDIIHSGTNVSDSLFFVGNWELSSYETYNGGIPIDTIKTNLSIMKDGKLIDNGTIPEKEYFWILGKNQMIYLIDNPDFSKEEQAQDITAKKFKITTNTNMQQSWNNTLLTNGNTLVLHWELMK